MNDRERIKAYIDRTIEAVVTAAVSEQFAGIRRDLAAIPIPRDGPAGRDGRDGRDGSDGKDGKDGIASRDEVIETVEVKVEERIPLLTAQVYEKVMQELPKVQYRGIWTSEAEYQPGDFVTDHGSVWHCNAETKERPGTGEAWTLAVKKGRDARSR